MAKTPGSTLITDLATRMGLDSTNATVRADMLRQLNISQQRRLQGHSFRFLVDDGTVSVSNNASSAAVPAGLDVGKTMTLGRADGAGEIQYVPIDEWYAVRLDTYLAATQTAPSYYTIVNDAGTDTFLFKPANTTGGSISIPYSAQKIPTALADSSSTSLLPEGWEDTILLDDAEGELRRFLQEPGWEALASRADDGSERLYSSYRTTKEQPMTDREQEERKVARETLGESK